VEHGTVSSGTQDLTSPPLAQVLVYPARVKILAVLADDPSASFGATDLADHADVDPSTWATHRDALLDLGLVRTVETDGPYPEYALAETSAGGALKRLSDELDDVLLDETDPIADAVDGFVR